MLRDPAALKADQAAQWQSGAEVRLQRAELIEKHWGGISTELLARAGVSPGQRVLDIGTGHGEPALRACGIVGPRGHVTGVDLSPEMLQAAQLRAARASVDNVAWLAQDAEQLDLPASGFDAAISRNSLMFLPRPRRAFEGVLAALRPGGCFAVAVVGPEETQAQWTMTVDALVASLGIPPPPRGKVGEPGVYSLSDEGALRALFEQAGYQRVQVEAQEMVYDFSDPNEVVTWHEINPTIRGLFDGRSPDDVRSAWRAVVETARHRADPDGHVRIPSQIIYATGHRPE